MRAWVLLGCVVFATSALGAIYENDSDLETEEDIIDANERGDLSTESMETLVEVLQEGVELNTATREELYDLPGLTYQDVDAILEYRKQKARIEDPAELVAAGAITGEQLLKIAPFVRIDPVGARLPVSGKARAVSQVANADNVAPPAMLMARAKGPYDLTAGVSLLTSRRMMDTPKYDPAFDTLVSNGFDYKLNVPYSFLRWKPGNAELIAGTFTAGFGERLILDNTRRRTPKGFYVTQNFLRSRDLSRTCKLSSPDPLTGACEEGVNRYITSDFTWREPFRGIAGSIEDLPLGGEKSLSAYAFLSYQTRSIYQYELYDRRTCDDPSSPDPGCLAPPVLLNDGSGVTRLIFSTVPYLYDELVAGSHIDFKPAYRYRLGITGYGAVPFFRGLDPMQLDFQEWSPHPGGGAYGALGIDGQASFENLSFHFEAGRSFDKTIGGGGGWGVVQRTVWNPKRSHDVEISLRYYDDKFAAAYARPVSAPDELDGQRARNELGVRVRHAARWNQDWKSTVRADFWVLPFTNPREGPAGTTNMYLLARADFTGWRVFQPAILIDFRNRNLASFEHGRCASGTIVFTPGEPFVCSGDSYRFALRLIVRPSSRLMLIGQSAVKLSDDIHYKDSFMVDVQEWVEARWRTNEWLHLRVRSVYLDQAVDNPLLYETSWWTFAEVAWLPRPGMRLALRYDLFWWLDQRDVTKTRLPNPESRVMVDLRTTF